MLKHDANCEDRVKMSDNVYHTLCFYRDNDKRGNGVMGTPALVRRKDVRICVKYGWLSERPVGVNSIYKLTKIGSKAVEEKEEYLNERIKTDPHLRKECKFTLDNRTRRMRKRQRQHQHTA